MNKDGRKLVLQVLRSRPMTRGEILDYMNKEKEKHRDFLSRTAVYDLINQLEDDRIVTVEGTEWEGSKIRKRGGGRVKLDFDEGKKREALELLRKEVTLSELAERLRWSSKEDNVRGRRADPTSKASDYLEILEAMGLVSRRKKQDDKQKAELWSLTWKGYNELGLCYQCKEKIADDGAAISFGVLSSFDPSVPLTGHRYFDAPLMHPNCFAKACKETFFSAEEAVFPSDCCDFCGLPLSPGLVRRLLEKNTYSDTHANEQNGKQSERLDALVDRLFGDVRSSIYAELDGNIQFIGPGATDAEIGPSNPYGLEDISMGCGFVALYSGKRYHFPCLEKLKTLFQERTLEAKTASQESPSKARRSD